MSLDTISGNFENLSYAEIRTQVEQLLNPLSKAEISNMATAANMTLIPGKAKAEWINSIVRRISERKGSWERMQGRFIAG